MNENKIMITRKSSSEVGSCNSCTKHLDIKKGRTKKHTVYEIDIGIMSVRLCTECFIEFYKQMKTEFF